MDPFSPLPDDDLGCILRMALAADGSTMQARCRLSVVCRRWRDSLRGAQPACCRLCWRRDPVVCVIIASHVGFGVHSL